MFSLRKKLSEAVTYEFNGVAPEKEQFVRLIELVREIVPGHVDYQVLEDSLRHLAGTQMDERVIDAVCWRIAGNVKRLKDMRSVPKWHVQRFYEWVPVQIISCRRELNKAGNMGARFAFRILAGTTAGLTAYKWWSLRMVRYISRELGFTRPRGRYAASKPYSQPEQFVSLRMYALIDPKHCDKEPGFSQVTFAPALNDWNKETIECRFRIMPGFECMEGRSKSESCHTCPVGFLRCRAGTHKMDWTRGKCPGCGKRDWFDPEVQTDLCIKCFVLAAYERPT